MMRAILTITVIPFGLVISTARVAFLAFELFKLIHFIILGD
jgi:hypothetical protein